MGNSDATVTEYQKPIIPPYVPFLRDDSSFNDACKIISYTCDISEFSAKNKLRAILEKISYSDYQFYELTGISSLVLAREIESTPEELQKIFDALEETGKSLYLKVIEFEDYNGKQRRILFSDWVIINLSKYVETYQKSVSRRTKEDALKDVSKQCREIVGTLSGKCLYKLILTKTNTINGIYTKLTEPETEQPKSSEPDPVVSSGSLVSQEDVHGVSQVSAESVVERPENVDEGIPGRISCSDGYADVGRFIEGWQARFKYIDVRKEISGIEKWLRGLKSDANHWKKADAYSKLSDKLEKKNADAKAKKSAPTGYDNSNLYIPKNLQG